MSARTYEQSAPAPVTEPMVGQTCVHCSAPFALGESIKDLFVYKFGELDWIETSHVNCEDARDEAEYEAQWEAECATAFNLSGTVL